MVQEKLRTPETKSHQLTAYIAQRRSEKSNLPDLTLHMPLLFYQCHSERAIMVEKTVMHKKSYKEILTSLIKGCV